MPVIPARNMNPLHIGFDIVFLVALIVLLLVKKRYMTVLFGLAGGVLYFIVDWGIFYLAMGTREIMINGAPMSEAGKFFFLLWMSMSYGFTNFAWIWLWLRKDEFLKEWSIFICTGWLAVAILSTGLGEAIGTLASINILRGTGKYHSFMALFVFIAYGAVVVYNLVNKKGERLPIMWMLAIGILVQFGWEAALLLGGVRPFDNPAQALFGIVVNSLIETNFGVPGIFLIQRLLYKKRGEALEKPLPPEEPAETLQVSG